MNELALELIPNNELAHYEQVIERGLHTFVEVGDALLAIRDARLYKGEYDTFEEYCQQRWGMERRYAYRLMDAAKVVGNVSHGTQIAPTTERQARPLSQLPPEQQREAWQLAVDTAPDGKVTARHVQATVNRMWAPPEGSFYCTDCNEAFDREVWHCPVCDHHWDMGREDCWNCHEYVRPEFRNRVYRVPTQTDVAPDPVEARPVSYHISDDSYEWYTPAEYIEAARAVMGSIDLDPASSDEAQTVVKAATYYTKAQDGLAQEWAGNVWLNPPYNMPLVEAFIDKLIANVESGAIIAALVLTNNSTDTGWFHKLLRYPVCFTRGRIRFWSGDDILATRQGQAIFYIGDNLDGFTDVFSAFGKVMHRYV